MAGIHRYAAVLSIGDELTLGQTLDTNSRFIASELLGRGVVTVEHTTVPDDRAAIAQALQRLATRVDLIVSTGGLGPTADDLTRPGLADAMSEALEEDAEALAQIKAYFASRSSPMRDLNRSQALRPQSGVCLANPNGTAPGLYGIIRAGGRQADVVCLPGPPREMKPMFEAEVLPRVRAVTGQTVATRSLHCFGLGESEVATRLGNLMDRDRNPMVGTTASQGVVSCRIRYEGSGSAAIAITGVENRIRDLLGPYLFGADADSLPSVVIDLLRARGENLATVESCTGGMLGELITDIAGSSDGYLGGWVTYTNQLKTVLVGVPAAMVGPGGPGAVSRDTAEAMAVGGLSRSRANHCLAITGIAGPKGGSPEKPVGTVWICRASGVAGAALDSRCFRFVGERAMVRDWSAMSALAMLRFYLIGEPRTSLMRQISPPSL